MKRSSYIKFALLALAPVFLVICVVVGAWFYFSYFYPYGNRGCGLQCVTIPLVLYANDHRGWFPNETGLPLQSLKMLYPYAAGGEIAGISGNVPEVRRRTKLGLDLDGRVSSLVYIPGLRDSDDPNLMIIYERQEGVCTTGRRLSGHAVGFVVGYVRQIPERDWAPFLKEQEALRAKAMSNRIAPINTDLVLSEHMKN